MSHDQLPQLNLYPNTSDIDRLDNDTAIGQGCKADQKVWEPSENTTPSERSEQRAKWLSGKQ